MSPQSLSGRLLSLIALLALSVPTAVPGAPAAPTLDLPVDSAKNQPTNPTLSWNASSGATSYRLQISTTADFSSTVGDQGGIAGTSQNVGNVLSNSTVSFGTPGNSYGDSRGKGCSAGCDQRLQFYRKPGGGYVHWEYAFGDLNDFGRVWEGNLSDPVAGGNTGTYSWSWNGITGHQCAWIMTVYQVNPTSPDTLLGIVHNETDGQDDGPYPWRLGLTISRNMGSSWTYCGDILKPAGCTTQGSNDWNVGGGIAITKDGYFYFYFNETPLPNLHPNDSTYPAVARAPISDVLSAARNNTVSAWKKYAAGAWNTDAFAGRGDRVLTLSEGPTSLPDMHESATFVKSTGTYLMGVNAQDAHKLKVFASVDGLTWNNEYTLMNASGAVGMCPYGSWAGDSASGASRDQWKQGNDFYFYWNYKKDDYVNDNYWYRSSVTVTPRTYYWRVNATDGTGAGAWSAARSFTTAAVIAGGAPVRASTPLSDHSRSADFAVSPHRANSGRLAVTFAVPENTVASRVSMSLYTMQGKIVREVVDAPVKSGVGTAELGANAVSPGRYLVRIRSVGMDKTVPVVFAR